MELWLGDWLIEGLLLENLVYTRLVWHYCMLLLVRNADVAEDVALIDRDGEDEQE